MRYKDIAICKETHLATTLCIAYLDLALNVCTIKYTGYITIQWHWSNGTLYYTEQSGWLNTNLACSDRWWFNSIIYSRLSSKYIHIKSFEYNPIHMLQSPLLIIIVWHDTRQTNSLFLLYRALFYLINDIPYNARNCIMLYLS